MRTERLAGLMLGALLVAGATDLAAQRRTTGSRGSSPGTTRQQPSRGSSSGGTRETPRRSEGSSGTQARDAGRTSTSVENGSSAAQGGRIAAVRDRARAARIRTSRGVRVVRGYWLGACIDCSYWGWYRGYWGWYHGGWWYPGYYPRYHRPDYEGEAEEVEPHDADRGFGTTFLDYPYSNGGTPDASFIQRNAPGRRAYGNLTMQYFGEERSQVEAGRFALEYGRGLFHGELAYSQYAEPIATGTDRMHVWRAAAGVQPRLTERANLVAAVALRGVYLTGGDDAYGPEAELGLQLLPFRPIGINLNARGAVLSWTGRDSFGFGELNATGSLFIGRLELQGGWHYMKLGSSPAFTGPVAGLRVWF